MFDFQALDSKVKVNGLSGYGIYRINDCAGNLPQFTRFGSRCCGEPRPAVRGSLTPETPSAPQRLIAFDVYPSRCWAQAQASGRPPRRSGRGSRSFQSQGSSRPSETAHAFAWLHSYQCLAGLLICERSLGPREEQRIASNDVQLRCHLHGGLQDVRQPRRVPQQDR